MAKYELKPFAGNWSSSVTQCVRSNPEPPSLAFTSSEYQYPQKKVKARRRRRPASAFQLILCGKAALTPLYLGSVQA